MSLIRRLRQRALTTAIICFRAALSQLAFGVSAIVTDEAGRVLLVRPRLGHGWALPGGGVDVDGQIGFAHASTIP